MTNNNIETTNEIVTRELLDFIRFHVDVKGIKNPLQRWKKLEFRFSIVDLAKQILRIVDSQIETNAIFSLAETLTSLKKCQLQSKNLNKVIFINQY
jgi:hypothetical protein